MFHNDKKIAVLLATYNGEKFLAELFDSLINQTCHEFKIYVHDDGSYDKTVSIIREYQEKYPCIIQELIYPPTGSSCANFMSMLTHVKSQYVMFCDQDDVWLPNKVEKVFHEMKKIEKENPDKPCLVFSNLYVVDSELNIISDSFMKYTDRDPYRTDYKSLLTENVAPGCTMILNRKLAERALCCNDISKISKIGFHDIWIILVASLEGKISYVDIPLIYYRQHQNNVIGTQKVSTIQKILYNLKRILLGKYGSDKKKRFDSLIFRAGLLSENCYLKSEDKKFLTSLANIRKCKKIERIKFYFNNALIPKKHWWHVFWI